jgi:small-conductance mechanosensitive channel
MTCALLRRAALVALIVAVSAEVRLAARQAQAGVDLSQVIASATAGEPAILRFNNRPVTVLRATILSRAPAERAAVAAEILETLVQNARPGPVMARPLQGLMIVSVGSRDVFGILPHDVDQLAGETLESKAAETVSRLQQALDEAVELRTPRRLLTSSLMALGASLLFVLLLVGTWRLHRVLAARLPGDAERQLKRLSAGSAQIAKASRASDFLKFVVTAGAALFSLFLLYGWLTFVLRRFPYTRPWGESLRAFLLDRLGTLGMGIVGSLPDLFTVLVILFLTRLAVRISNSVFQAAEAEQISLPYVYPETAPPTRRLVAAVLWLLAIVLAYPYFPGSESDAFKGISVFVGLVISLGSSGIVNQMMSGLTITYSRALRIGDFVRIGDVEGTVTHLGSLSTKVKSPRGEEVTIPNAVVMSQVTTNYSRLAASDGVYVPTSLTIGYDTPWRQVRALLLLAAERTPGILDKPKPVVRQSALQDFYVQYTLLVCLEQPSQRGPVLDALHGNIQDAFNEYGVQIMSPNYEADPEERKVVSPEEWYAAPARRPGAG